MKGLLILLTSVLASSPALAGTVAFKDLFHAYSKSAQLKEELHLLRERADLEADTREETQSRLSAKLAEYEVDIEAIYKLDLESFSPWEKEVAIRLKAKRTPSIKKMDPEALRFLTENFPKAKSWSPLEWQAVGEWFGRPTQDEFLRQTFETGKISDSKVHSSEGITVAWVNDPSQRFLHKQELAKVKADRERLRADLEKEGIHFEVLEVSAFSRFEDQAEELHLALLKREEVGELILLSSGNGSAILLRTLDLNPALLSKKEIRGWLNVNGQLFGRTDAIRTPASLSVADRQANEARNEHLLWRKERIETQTPLGAKFPVVNLVTTGGKFRPQENLRESLVPEGRTFFMEEGTGLDAVHAAIQLVNPIP